MRVPPPPLNSRASAGGSYHHRNHRGQFRRRNRDNAGPIALMAATCRASNRGPSSTCPRGLRRGTMCSLTRSRPLAPFPRADCAIRQDRIIIDITDHYQHHGPVGDINVVPRRPVPRVSLVRGPGSPEVASRPRLPAGGRCRWRARPVRNGRRYPGRPGCGRSGKRVASSAGSPATSPTSRQSA